MRATKRELAEHQEWQQRFDAMPIAAKVAFYRGPRLAHCLRWRAFIRSGKPGHPEINPKFMLKREQMLLLRLRQMRAAGWPTIH